MAWQSEVGAGAVATDYHDFLDILTSFACSRHVATVVINNGGTGGTYVVGDIVTLTDATAHLDARFEVTGVTTGQIDTLRIVASGSFGDRLDDGTLTVSAGGTGYSNSITDLILEVQGGTSRMPAKVKATTNGSGVVTSIIAFEDHGSGTMGVYSANPSFPAATVILGPNATGAGTGCTVTLATQAEFASGLTNLAVTGGGGTGATVDITLAETGWTVDGRNSNDISFNSVLNEKQVVLVGDAAGKTNKPYVGLMTCSFTSGINERYSLAFHGMVTHNPSVAMSAQVNILGTPETWGDGETFLTFPQDQTENVEFWITVDDVRIAGVTNTHPAAATSDDGEYMHFYIGSMDTFATETEDPYPYFAGASSRSRNLDTPTSSTSITGLGEAIAPAASASGMSFYRSEDATWRRLANSVGPIANQERIEGIWPMMRLTLLTGDNCFVVNVGPHRFDTGFGSIARASPTIRLLPIPGATTDEHFPLPLTVLSRPGGTNLNETLDTTRGQLRGCFWVYNTDSAGSTIVDFSEDYITIGTDRYYVFHTHVQRQLYHYICVKEDV